MVHILLMGFTLEMLVTMMMVITTELAPMII